MAEACGKFLRSHPLPHAPWRNPAASGVGKPVSAVGVVAVDPAAHRGGIAAQQPGDRRRRPALVGQQDHDQAQADAVGPAAGRAGRRGSLRCRWGWRPRWGGRILAAASSARLCCGRLQRPVRLLHLGDPPPSVTSRTSGHPLSAASLASRGAVPTAHSAPAQRLALKILVGADGALPNRR